MKTVFVTALRLAVVCLSLFITTATFAQQVIKDDSYNDQSFVAFKAKLLAAVLNRDTSVLFALVHDDVKISDESCTGIPIICFKQLFAELPRQVNPAWDELYRAISYGFNETTIQISIPGYARKGEVVYQAPSYISFLPDREDQLLVLGEMVNIRYAPSTKATVITRVTYKALNYNDPYTSPSATAFNMVDGKMWYEVILGDGQRGYIHEDYVSASLNREVSVRKIEGEWKIVSFYKRTTAGC